MRALLLTACFCLLVSCAGTQHASRGGSEASSSTRYRLGDFVVYRYQGVFTSTPVVLREEITGQDRNRLRIDVTATRGPEARRWVQIVTDTVENQRNNVIDALFEVRESEFVRLPNTANRDILRLYEWVLLQPEGRMVNPESRPCAKEFAGRRFECTCTTGHNTWNGRGVTFEDSECPDFLWTHGPGGFRDQETGEDVLRIEVLEFGRRSNAMPQTFNPD